jgi:hypothetical protein
MAGQGNDAAMREALEFTCHIDDDGYTSFDVDMAIQKARAALAAPPRNCDVGTAEEQIKRIRRLCKKYRDEIGKCKGCPVHGVFPKDCALIWAQMPYEEGSGYA